MCIYVNLRVSTFNKADPVNNHAEQHANREIEPPVEWCYPKKNFQADQNDCTADISAFAGDPANFDGDQADPEPDYADQHANRADRPWVT